MQQKNRAKAKQTYRILRRGQDIVLSLVALIVLLPLMGIVALAVWVDSPGASPLFAQTRVGLAGKPFRLLKFRSMIPNAEENLEALLDANDMDGPVFKLRNDPRITRVGRFLRSTGIDELPQLINIIRGDMSLVGPRPALPREAAQYDERARQRLSVRPGLTCYWQIQPDRNELTFEEWLALDMQYIRERSFLTDWKIILGTFRAVFRRDGW